jgi:hypothetical protein
MLLAPACLALPGSWASVGSLKTARLDHQTTLNDGTILAEGGSTGGSTLSSAEIYDPAHHNWRWDYAGVGLRWGRGITLGSRLNI